MFSEMPDLAWRITASGYSPYRSRRKCLPDTSKALSLEGEGERQRLQASPPFSGSNAPPSTTRVCPVM